MRFPTLRTRSTPIVALASLAPLLAIQASAVSANDPKILEFDTMVGVPSALTGAQAPIRGVNGGGLPWTLTAARGELSAGGHLEIRVDGLVLAAGDNAGSNPITTFRGLLSCLAADGSIQNVATDPFPASTGSASAGGWGCDHRGNPAVARAVHRLDRVRDEPDARLVREHRRLIPERSTVAVPCRLRRRSGARRS